jgi:F-box-like
MDLGGTKSNGVANDVQNVGVGPSHSENAVPETPSTTPKIVEPDPSDDGGPSSEGNRATRAKEKRHNRTRSASRRRSWKYPNGPPAPQPNQERLTLEQCLNLTERDLFKRHEYHKTSIAQKEIYIQYLKFLIETSSRLLYPPGPSPRAAPLCTTSFGSDFSRFLDDVRYDGDDNIRWITNRVATPVGGARRDYGGEQPEDAADSEEGTKGDSQGRSLVGISGTEDTKAVEPTDAHQESMPTQSIQPEGDQYPSKAERNEDTIQPGRHPNPQKTTSRDTSDVGESPAVCVLEGCTNEGDGEGERVTVAVPEKAPVSPATPTEAPTVAPTVSSQEIQGPTPTVRAPRSAILDPERTGNARGLQGEVHAPLRPKSRGISGSTLPIPYQSDQERLWLKYHEMQLHFDAEIDEMDARMKVLQEHLVRVGGSTDAYGVSRAGDRTETHGINGEEEKANTPRTSTTEVGGLWLRDVRRTIDTLKEMATGPKQALRSHKPETAQQAKPTSLLLTADSTKLGASTDVPPPLETPKVHSTTKTTAGGRSLNGLPYEILSTILKYLPAGKRATLSVTCHLWHEILTPMVWRSVALDDDYEVIVGRRRACQELKRMAASNEEKGKGKQNTSVQTFWPIACLTVQTSLSSGNSSEAGGSIPVDSGNTDSGNVETDKDNTKKTESAPLDEDKDWWGRGLRKSPLKIPKSEHLEMTPRDRAVCYNESLALMPATISLLTALR